MYELILVSIQRANKSAILAFIMYRDTPVASHGDPDVLGVPFQEHGTCQVINCLLFTTTVLVCVIQSALCQPLLLHLPQPPFCPSQLLHLSKTPLMQVCVTTFARNTHINVTVVWRQLILTCIINYKFLTIINFLGYSTM